MNIKQHFHQVTSHNDRYLSFYQTRNWTFISENGFDYWWCTSENGRIDVNFTLISNPEIEEHLNVKQFILINYSDKIHHELYSIASMKSVYIPVFRGALIVPACQPGWEEMEKMRGNLTGNNSQWSQPGREEVPLMSPLFALNSLKESLL